MVGTESTGTVGRGCRPLAAGSGGWGGGVGVEGSSKKGGVSQPYSWTVTSVDPVTATEHRPWYQLFCAPRSTT